MCGSSTKLGKRGPPSGAPWHRAACQRWAARGYSRNSERVFAGGMSQPLPWSRLVCAGSGAGRGAARGRDRRGRGGRRAGGARSLPRTRLPRSLHGARSAPSREVSLGVRGAPPPRPEEGERVAACEAPQALRLRHLGREEGAATALLPSCAPRGQRNVPRPESFCPGSRGGQQRPDPGEREPEGREDGGARSAGRCAPGPGRGEAGGAGAAAAGAAGLGLGSAARLLPRALRVFRDGPDGEVREQEPHGGAPGPAALRAAPLPHGQPARQPPARRLPFAAAAPAQPPQPERQPPGAGGGGRLRQPAQPEAAGPERQRPGQAQPRGLRQRQQPPREAEPQQLPQQPERGVRPGRAAGLGGAGQPEPPGAGRQQAALPACGHVLLPAQPAAPGPAEQLPGELAGRDLPQPGPAAEPRPQPQLPEVPEGRHHRPAPQPARAPQDQPGPQHLGLRLLHRALGELAQGERPGGRERGLEVLLP